CRLGGGFVSPMREHGFDAGGEVGRRGGRPPGGSGGQVRAFGLLKFKIQGGAGGGGGAVIDDGLRGLLFEYQTRGSDDVWGVRWRGRVCAGRLRCLCHGWLWRRRIRRVISGKRG